MKSVKVLSVMILATIVLFAAIVQVGEAQSTYTGCLNLKSGVLSQVAVGNLPLGGSCAGQTLQIQWNQQGIPGQQGPPGPAGSVAEVGTGVGLTGGPITDSGTISLDTAYTDERYVTRSLAASGPADVGVDCDAGQSINAAINAAPVFGHLGIAVMGTCREYMDITRNDTTLYGISDDAAIEAPTSGGQALDVENGARVAIKALTIRGAVGVWDANVVMEETRVTGSAGIGIFLNGATLTLRDSSVDGHLGAGIYAMSLPSNLRLVRSTIENNANGGVFLGPHSTAVVEQSLISDNGGSGVALWAASVADIQSSTIEYHHIGIGAAYGSMVRFGGATTIQGNDVGISLADASLAGIAGPSIVKDNSSIGISCEPPPATAQLAGDRDSISFENNGTDTNCP